MLRPLIAVLLIVILSAGAVGQILRAQQQPRDARPAPGSQPHRLPAPAPIPPDPEIFTLAQLESIALQNNPTLVFAAARLDIARGSHQQAGLYPNPVVGYHGVEIGLRDTVGQQGSYITQRIITAGKLRLDQDIAQREIDQSRHILQAQQQRVLSDIRVRFYEALVAQRRVELSGELARIGSELVTATTTLLDGGRATENDLLQAEIKADESQILLDNARNQHVEAWQRLAVVAGTPALPLTQLDGQLDDQLPRLDWESCYSTVMNGNPRLAAARAHVDRAGIAIRRAQVEPIPNIDLSVSVRYHNVTRDDVANVQIGIPIPIFDRNQGDIFRAEAEWVAACAEVKRMELQLQDELAKAYQRYLSAAQQVERYRDRMVPRARRSLELVTGGYEQGQVEYLTLLTAQQTFIQVHLANLNAQRELRTSSAVIQSQLLTDSLVIDRVVR